LSPAIVGFSSFRRIPRRTGQRSGGRERSSGAALTNADNARLSARAARDRLHAIPRIAPALEGWKLRVLERFVQRLAVLGLGIVAVWLIVYVFRITDRRLPTILSLWVAYMLAAYLILPRIVRMSVKILQRKKVPSFTLTGDGLPGDPVNLVLIGKLDKVRAAFVAAGWTEADALNRPYPGAPFSTLFLFGRGQDVGFQKAINGSPRKRHHVRFWSLSLEQTEETLGTAEFWLNTDRPADEEAALWVGAATKDTGMSFTRFTFKVTHKTASDTNAERDLIVSELKRVGAVASVASYQAGESLEAGRVNHYVTDGEVAAASLA
jgi:LssY C-terminus